MDYEESLDEAYPPKETNYLFGSILVVLSASSLVALITALCLIWKKKEFTLKIEKNFILCCCILCIRDLSFAPTYFVGYWPFHHFTCTIEIGFNNILSSAILVFVMFLNIGLIPIVFRPSILYKKSVYYSLAAIPWIVGFACGAFMVLFELYYLDIKCIAAEPGEYLFWILGYINLIFFIASSAIFIILLVGIIKNKEILKTKEIYETTVRLFKRNTIIVVVYMCQIICIRYRFRYTNIFAVILNLFIIYIPYNLFAIFTHKILHFKDNLEEKIGMS